MRVEADGGIPLWPLHLARLRRDCAAVGFPFDEAGVLRALPKAGPHVSPLRVRLTVNRAGRVTVACDTAPVPKPLWQVMIATERLSSSDPWLRIKTSYRPGYTAARAALPHGMDEAILLNEAGEVCDGTITSVFLRQADRLLTPPLSCGVLPGVLRQSLLDQGHADEAVLRPDDLTSGQLFLGNALRGLIPASLCR